MATSFQVARIDCKIYVFDQHKEQRSVRRDVADLLAW
jgi:hypothetical protein